MRRRTSATIARDFGETSSTRPGGRGEALRLSLNDAGSGPARSRGSRFSRGSGHNTGRPRLKFRPRAKPNLALILGGTGARLEDLVGAYGAQPRNGIAGRVRYPGRSAVDRRVLSPGAVLDHRDILGSMRVPEVAAPSIADAKPRVWPGRPAPALTTAWICGQHLRYKSAWISRRRHAPVPGMQRRHRPPCCSGRGRSIPFVHSIVHFCPFQFHPSSLALPALAPTLAVAGASPRVDRPLACAGRRRAVSTRRRLPHRRRHRDGLDARRRGRRHRPAPGSDRPAQLTARARRPRFGAVAGRRPPGGRKVLTDLPARLCRTRSHHRARRRRQFRPGGDSGAALTPGESLHDQPGSCSEYIEADCGRHRPHATLDSPPGVAGPAQQHRAAGTSLGQDQAQCRTSCRSPPTRSAGPAEAQSCLRRCDPDAGGRVTLAMADGGGSGRYALVFVAQTEAGASLPGHRPLGHPTVRRAPSCG